MYVHIVSFFLLQPQKCSVKWCGKSIPRLNLKYKCLIHLKCNKKEKEWSERKTTRKIEDMVFCYQNCSDLLWEKIVLVRKTFKIRGWRPRICKIFQIIRTIYSNRDSSEQLLVAECFFNLFLEVSKPNKFEQFKFKFEKNIGI